MILKPDLIKMLQKEFATTEKVLYAYPENKLDFKPHERSQNARGLITTFIFEMFLMKIYAFGENINRAIFKEYNPDNLGILISDFTKHSSDIISGLRDIPEEKLSAAVEFAGTKFSASDFILMMLHDQIHHRGQLTVYLRMAGGKVPSVYGPSADDSSTNF